MEVLTIHDSVRAILEFVIGSDTVGLILASWLIVSIKES